MSAAIDTSSLLSLVRYYLPFDKTKVLFDFFNCKILGLEITTLPELLKRYKEIELEIK